MEKDVAEDPVMQRIRDWLNEQEPKLSLQELGERMGFPATSARKSAWQFLQCRVPRLDTLRRFAAASGVPIEEWVAEQIQQKKREGRTVIQQRRTREQAERGLVIDRILLRLEQCGINPFFGKNWDERRTGLKEMTTLELEQLKASLQPSLTSKAATTAVVDAITASRHKREGAS